MPELQRLEPDVRVQNVDGLVWANQAWTISDIRTKENIRALPYGLAHPMGLRPVMFDFIAGAKEQLGFIAQEVRAVVPEIVMEEEANADYTIDLMLALNPSGIIPIPGSLSPGAAETDRGAGRADRRPGRSNPRSSIMTRC